jgi:hypothetical protein
MKNQFFYQKKEMLPPQEGDTEPKFFEGLDSFNLEKVIRSISIPDGQRLILLDDLHERVHEVEIKNKQGKVTSIKRERDAFQSEIYLSPTDSMRFMEIF